MAEERHRLRVLREREIAAGGAPRKESIAEAVSEAARSGMGAARVRAFLARCVVEPVFTAHPSEARRRTVLEHLRRLAALVEAMDDPRHPPLEVAAVQDLVPTAIAALWLTEEVRHRAPTSWTRCATASTTSRRHSSTWSPASPPRWIGAGGRLSGNAFRAVLPPLRILMGGDRDGNPT